VSKDALRVEAEQLTAELAAAMTSDHCSTQIEQERLQECHPELLRLSSAGERSLHTGEVVGSIPTASTIGINNLAFISCHCAHVSPTKPMLKFKSIVGAMRAPH
jgi:hypothetical protein